MRRSAGIVAGLLALAFPVVGVNATDVIPKDLRELSREAEAIVRARVIETRAAWNADRTLIWTANLVRIEETWKGSVTGFLSVVEPGGAVGDSGMVVAGAPRYQPGEDVVLFLRRDVLGQWRTHGWHQGRFTVGRDSAGRAVAVPPCRAVIAAYFPEPDSARAIDLDLLRRRVRDLAVAPAGGGR